jgi:MFS family permease
MLIGTLLMLPCYAVLALEPSGFNLFGFHASITVLLLVMLGLEGIFEGITLPSSNNACIELMPERVATITSMRSMFRQAGSAAGITVGSIILNTAGIAPGFRIMFFGLVALGLLVMLPSIFAMPSGK